jgi:hypothetical protein
MDEKLKQLLQSLPPLTACVVWDVIRGNITAQTIELADVATDEEWAAYDVIRCVAAGNPQYPPFEEAHALVDIMLDEFQPEAQ